MASDKRQAVIFAESRKHLPKHNERLFDLLPVKVGICMDPKIG